jgi:hypothetical protein
MMRNAEVKGEAGKVKGGKERGTGNADCGIVREMDGGREAIFYHG